jgi:hypothetical protein
MNEVPRKLRDQYMNAFVRSSEITINDKSNNRHTIHSNVFDYTEDQHNEILRIQKMIRKGRAKLEDFTNYCNEQEIAFQYNHLLWLEVDENKELLKKAGLNHDFRRLEYDPELNDKIQKAKDLYIERVDSVIEMGKLFDVYEVGNSGRPEQTNYPGLILAELENKGQTSSDDDHYGGVGSKSLTAVHGETFSQAWKNIMDGDSKVLDIPLNKETLLEETLKSMHHLAHPDKVIKISNHYFCDVGDPVLNFAMKYILNHSTIASKFFEPIGRRKAPAKVNSYIGMENDIGVLATDHIIDRSTDSKTTGLDEKVRIKLEKRAIEPTFVG